MDRITYLVRPIDVIVRLIPVLLVIALYIWMQLRVHRRWRKGWRLAAIATIYVPLAVLVIGLWRVQVEKWGGL